MDDPQLDVVLAMLMNEYDKRFPTAGSFHRGEMEYRYRRALEDIDAIGYKVVQK